MTLDGKVYFRADAGRATGYGHYVRSTALAAMLRKDFDCTVFTAEPTEFQRKEAEGICKLETLPGDDSRFGLFLDRLEGGETVVLDNYFYTDEYIGEIKAKGCKTVLIQDFFGKATAADAMILPCRNPRWALLREPFIDGDHADVREKGLWVVAIGATDPLGLTGRFVRALEKRGRKVSVLSGGMGAREVAELFRRAEGVVCSASSVCYEALACGCRVCAGWYVDNQKDFYSVLCRMNLILPLGKLQDAALPDDSDNAPDGGAVSDSFRAAPRNCRALFHALELEMVNYTALSDRQILEVWEARNREEIRRYMTNPDPIPFEDHMKFIGSLATRKDKLYYAFFKNGEFVGSIDFVGMVPGESAERGLYVAPEWQGRGIAAAMDCLMDSEAAKLGLGTLRAEVLGNNARSLAFHRSMGYEVTGEKDGMLYLQKVL